MALQGQHHMDMTFQQAGGYPVDMVGGPSSMGHAGQHVYNNQGAFVVHQPGVADSYGANPPTLSHGEQYGMHTMAAMGMSGPVPHHGIGIDHHSTPAHAARKSAGAKTKSPPSAAAVLMDPHKVFDRKEKNRQAAQRSRKRKQDHIDDLESTVQRQSMEIESLRTELVAAKSRLNRHHVGAHQRTPMLDLALTSSVADDTVVQASLIRTVGAGQSAPGHRRSCIPNGSEKSASGDDDDEDDL
eukprot:m.166819 g.166819  ORF g.166819 m.166819 type:complete len:242 (+) comp24065_c0_seq1:136-861(+)